MENEDVTLISYFKKQRGQIPLPQIKGEGWVDAELSF